MLNLRSAALAFVLLHVIGVCVDLVDAVVSCPPPNEKAEDWVNCENGYDATASTCLSNGGSCNSIGCYIGGTLDTTGLTCVSCEDACGGKCCANNG